MRPPQQPNRLAATQSPYLQQHAHQPVDWWPWCEEALALARAEDRPILLSIGYSACHWCHVMAHESFDDPATAALMNRLFVNIKVDREERPDLDRIYQSAHQLLAQRPGGWPLTAFLTPDDQSPFFAGTYFPGEARHGLPAFRDLLQAIAGAYREQRAAIAEQGASLRAALDSLDPPRSRAAAVLDAGPIDRALRQLREAFDRRHGGFGRAPKFPHPTDLELLLHRALTTAIAGSPDGEARHQARFTLERMALGGLQDQIGGGFSRYSVDERWEIPHFEKMLYDNGQLLGLYCLAWQLGGEALFRDTALGIADWVLREMQGPGGGYYAALDADSEGEEGRFYLWTPAQVEAALGGADHPLFAAAYGLDRPPNFEGRWHLNRVADSGTLAARFGLAPWDVDERLTAARKSLLGVRAARTPPGLDDKVLTAWNAMMIKGMARAARLFQRPDYLDSAERALAFLRENLWREGRLLASARGDQAQLPAYLDDYANLIDALLELLQTRWRRADLELAIDLAEVLLERFEDTQAGGFFFTAHDHEPLLHRPKPLADEALPSGNGVAARVLIRLGHLLGETRYLEAAERTLRLAWGAIEEMPYAHASLLLALDEWLHPTEVVVARAPRAELQPWQERLQRGLAPRRLALAIPTEDGGLPGILGSSPPEAGPVATLCGPSGCLAPIRDLASLDRQLGLSELAGLPDRHP